MSKTTEPRPTDGYIDAALEALGSEDTEFWLKGRASEDCEHAVQLSCRYQGCQWGIYVGEMELWEFVADARQHWEGEHAPPKPAATTADRRTSPNLGYGLGRIPRLSSGLCAKPTFRGSSPSS